MKINECESKRQRSNQQHNIMQPIRVQFQQIVLLNFKFAVNFLNSSFKVHSCNFYQTTKIIRQNKLAKMFVFEQLTNRAVAMG
jgi:hypothetical protein